MKRFTIGSAPMRALTSDIWSMSISLPIRTSLDGYPNV